MPLRRNRTVELAVRIIAAPHQRLDRAVGGECDKSALADVKGCAFAIERLSERFFRRSLQAAVERRRDSDIFIDRTDCVIERVHHEIRGVIDRARILVPDGLRGMGQGEQRHRIGDETFLTHRLDDLLRALGGTGRIAIRRKSRWRLHQPSEDRRFRQRHIAGAVAKVFLRRGFDAIGAGAEINAVQIQFENLSFRIFMLKPERQDRFLDFARSGPLLGQKEILGELLRQGRTALHRAAAR